MKTIVPIFFSVNDSYSPYLATALASIKDNASKEYTYRIHILSDDISEPSREKLLAFSDEDFQIGFYPLTERLQALPGVKNLQEHCFGAFSSLTIYFRLFIPVLFPQYDKAIYLDCDIVVPGDISQLWEEPLGHYLLGAVADYSIQNIAPFLNYIDNYVGVDHRNYVNSGVLLLNCKRLREMDLSGRFLECVEKYSLEAVAPDQDYLNTLCWGGIMYLDPNWNAMPSECLPDMENPHIIHFNLSTKPWLNEIVPYGELFWKYARHSGFFRQIVLARRAFLQDVKAVRKYKNAVAALIKMAVRLTSAPQSFRSIISSRKELRLCS